MDNLIAIAMAGALGTLARYGISGLSYRLLGERFACGTLAANLLGCLLPGVLPKLDEMIGEGLVTMERVAVLRYAQAARMTADRTQCT